MRQEDEASWGLGNQKELKHVLEKDEMFGQEEEQLEKLQNIFENMKVQYEDQHNPAGTDFASAWVPSVTTRLHFFLRHVAEVRRHRGSVCSGISEDAEYWRDVQHGSMSCLVSAYLYCQIIHWAKLLH